MRSAGTREPITSRPAENLCGFPAGGCIVPDTMLDDINLLEGYVERRSEGDFARLVERHLGMVFATALRRVGGDRHLAEDVAQSVFIDLARKAPAVSRNRILAGWLYTSTVYAAAKVVRAEQRRRRREEQALAMQELHDDASSSQDWTQMRPVLDDALGALSRADRDAILLRFFQEQGFSAIGAALNVSENAARMRVERALDKLHRQLARRGIRSTLAALATTLSVHAAGIAPPAALAVTVTSSALAGVSGAGGLTLFLNLIAMTKVQVGILATVAAIGAGAVSFELREQYELRQAIAAHASDSADERVRLRSEIARLEQTTEDFRALQSRAGALARMRRETSEIRERLAQLNPQARAAAAAQLRQTSTANGKTPPTRPLSEFDQAPRLKNSVSPRFPSELSRAGIPGEVTVSFVVSSGGEVQDVKVVESTHPAFVEPALEAVRQWEFSNGMKGGRPVNTRVELPLSFTLDSSNWF